MARGRTAGVRRWPAEVRDGFRMGGGGVVLFARVRFESEEGAGAQRRALKTEEGRVRRRRAVRQHGPELAAIEDPVGGSRLRAEGAEGRRSSDCFVRNQTMNSG
jgi:hypothetical protein